MNKNAMLKEVIEELLYDIGVRGRVYINEGYYVTVLSDMGDDINILDLFKNIQFCNLIGYKFVGREDQYLKVYKMLTQPNSEKKMIRVGRLYLYGVIDSSDDIDLMSLLNQLNRTQ